MLLLALLHIFFVSFTDKPLAEAPALSPRAIEQRQKWSIEIDESDYPVHQPYLDSIRHMGVTICHTSRWYNGATCRMSEKTADSVAQLGFVMRVEKTREEGEKSPKNLKELKDSKDPKDSKEFNTTAKQLDLFNLRALHQAGFEGQGILMAICDAGFYNADTLSAFRQELELGHFDFTDDQDPFYGSEGTHGTHCLSTITAQTDQYAGAATKAQYYLMRSEEIHAESPKEMDNLIAALEKADSLGVNVFSVSLGYFYFDNPEWNLTNEMMDGQATRLSRAATTAARKGMLVCVAAGNEGESAWKKICSPADADSILSVGAVNTEGMIGAFSGHGPSADGRTKPEVCAVGVQTALIAPNNTIVLANGTSFATPLIAGLAASLWSALPNENAMQIRNRIIASADRTSTPDRYQYGYGIPDAWKAYTIFPENTENIEKDDNSNKCTKVLHNGQLLIVRHGQVYSLTGQRIK